MRIPSDKELKEILQNSKTIAVVGLSPKQDRPSYHVTEYLIDSGYTIYGVNPGVKTILDLPCYSSLLDVPRPVDIVDVFRQPDAVPEIVEQAIKIGAKVLWLQEGVGNPEAEEKALAAGMKVISDHCILKERIRLMR